MYLRLGKYRKDSMFNTMTAGNGDYMKLLRYSNIKYGHISLSKSKLVPISNIAFLLRSKMLIVGAHAGG